MQELGRTSLSDFKLQQKRPLHLVLDNIRSGHNVGQKLLYVSPYRHSSALLRNQMLSNPMPRRYSKVGS